MATGAFSDRERAVGAGPPPFAAASRFCRPGAWRKNGAPHLGRSVAFLLSAVRLGYVQPDKVNCEITPRMSPNRLMTPSGPSRLQLPAPPVMMSPRSLLTLYGGSPSRENDEITPRMSPNRLMTPFWSTSYQSYGLYGSRRPPSTGTSPSSDASGQPSPSLS